jgi:hypothetical protein
MAPSLYPRGTVKKIVKAHSNRPMSKNVDILVSWHSMKREVRNVRLTWNADLPQLCAVYARVRTCLLHYAPLHRSRFDAMQYLRFLGRLWARAQKAGYISEDSKRGNIEVEGGNRG